MSDSAPARHVLCSVMEFEDGSVSCIELHRGPRDECELLSGHISAVANSTGKRSVRAFLALPTEAEYAAATGEAPRSAAPEKCQRCNKSPAAAPHTCPYAGEIHDDNETLCNCCDECVGECLRDI